jgi:hypothetical protein
MKENIWNILVKYDNGLNDKFCNALSKILQNKENDNDLITILDSQYYIDKMDFKILNKIFSDRLRFILF